jgi:VIT1/CCC1 family predicted Fe2+/Mn2+ transporter
MDRLSHWESFYVIVGSSGAALTGLQFVVIALVADVRSKSSSREIDAFATPTIVHFCAVLLVSAILSAPWASWTGPAVTLTLAGVAGVGYTVIIARRARRQKGYVPVFEDWLCHVALPFVAYGLTGAAALTLGGHATGALFVIGAMTLLLLFVGIHNAWDTVTYIVITAPEEKAKPKPPQEVKP